MMAGTHSPWRQSRRNQTVPLGAVGDAQPFNVLVVLVCSVGDVIDESCVLLLKGYRGVALPFPGRVVAVHWWGPSTAASVLSYDLSVRDVLFEVDVLLPAG